MKKVTKKTARILTKVGSLATNASIDSYSLFYCYQEKEPANLRHVNGKKGK